MNHTFPEAWRKGIYAAIFCRRDMRRFRSDHIPPEVIARILLAAHHAPSVGFMQPWNFLVIEDIQIRQQVHAHVDEERIRAAEGFAGERQKNYLSYKLEGIVEAPINMCVTCDPTRFGPAVIGRNTIPETDVYSTCCAVQNLWLAARAEGIGVGWVSILKPDRLREILGIPRHIVPVAYLCVGYVDHFPEESELETAGWQQRLKLDTLIFGDQRESRPSPQLSAALGNGGAYA